MTNLSEEAKKCRIEVIEAVKVTIDDFRQIKGATFSLTKSLLVHLSDAAGRLGYISCPSETDAEWLYDVVWYKMGVEDHLTNVFLTMESELSDRSINGIRYDFQKLLISNAPVKIMLCLAPSKESKGISKLTEKFQNWINACENVRPGEQFLIMIWDDYESDSVFEYQLMKE